MWRRPHNRNCSLAHVNLFGAVHFRLTATRPFIGRPHSCEIPGGGSRSSGVLSSISGAAVNDADVDDETAKIYLFPDYSNAIGETWKEFWKR